MVPTTRMRWQWCQHVGSSCCVSCSCAFSRDLPMNRQIPWECAWAQNTLGGTYVLMSLPPYPRGSLIIMETTCVTNLLQTHCCVLFISCWIFPSYWWVVRYITHTVGVNLVHTDDLMKSSQGFICWDFIYWLLPTNYKNRCIPIVVFALHYKSRCKFQCAYFSFSLVIDCSRLTVVLTSMIQ